MLLELVMCWVVPLPSSSHHQDFYIFSRGSLYKPLFATITGNKANPNYLVKIIATSHDLTPNGVLVRDISYFREVWVGEIII